METPLAVGTVYVIVSAIGILLNSLTIRAIVAQGKLKQNYAGMYILYMQPLITDMLYELIHMGYIAPSIIIGEVIFPRYLAAIIDAAQTYCFYNNSLSHVILAVNRFVVTVLLRFNFFTTSRGIVMAVTQHALALAIAAAIHFVLPCCRIVLSPSTYSYPEVVIPGVPNYAWMYLKMPLKVSCSAIPFIIYAVILLSRHFIGRHVKLESRELRKRRLQELRFTVQFASIAAVYTVSWGTFALLPLMNFTLNNVWMQGFNVVLNLLNSTTNAVVFLLNDVWLIARHTEKFSKWSDKKKLCGFCMSAPSVTGSSNGH